MPSIRPNPFRSRRSFYLLIIALPLLILGIIVLLLVAYNNFFFKDHTQKTVQQAVERVENLLLSQRQHALSLAILFAKDHILVNALKTDNPDMASQELQTIIRDIDRYTHISTIQIQIHTTDLRSFVRSWEKKGRGSDLKDYRFDLKMVQAQQRPFASVSLGKRPNIKAIAPMYDASGTFIGTLEVITDFKMIKEQLAQDRIRILPLLHKGFLNIATYCKGNAEVGDYVTAEKSYDHTLYQLVRYRPELTRMSKRYERIGDTLITTVPLRDMDDRTIGTIFVSIPVGERNGFKFLPTYQIINTPCPKKESANPAPPTIIERKVTIQ